VNTVISLLTIQGALTAADQLWHHGINQSLSHAARMRRRPALRGIRSALDATLFVVFAWLTLHGWVAYLLVALLGVKFVLALHESVEENRTRALQASEHILHTVVALIFGWLIVALAPMLVEWAAQPASVAVSAQSWHAWLFTLYAAAALGWAIRDRIAAWRGLHPQLASWQRQGFQIRRCARPQRVLIAGATGFIGRLVARRLIERGHRIIVFARNRAKALDLYGPHAQIVTTLDSLRANERIDAVINLAGEPIAAARWSSARKALLVESRIGTTRMLVEWARHLQRPLAVFINASAVGWYGTHTASALRESDKAGQDFPAALCNAWEREAARARNRCSRVVILRLGLVLGSGGLLQRLLPMFRMGLGAPIGNGLQWMSWIHADDVVAIVEHALSQESWHGTINVVAPQPVCNREFSATLARTCARPLWPAVPAMPLRWMFGELSMVVLEGQRVEPAALNALGYRFRFPALGAALRDLLEVHSSPTAAEEVEHA
jgi:uncharacterized protein (TIGR01777 family)